MEDIFKLTTAQEIEIAVRLLLAAIFGLAVGSGLYIASVSGTVLVLVILYLFAPARRKEE